MVNQTLKLDLFPHIHNSIDTVRNFYWQQAHRCLKTEKKKFCFYVSILKYSSLFFLSNHKETLDEIVSIQKSIKQNFEDFFRYPSDLFNRPFDEILSTTIQNCRKETEYIQYLYSLSTGALDQIKAQNFIQTLTMQCPYIEAVYEKLTQGSN